jgi:hypothetical protein
VLRQSNQIREGEENWDESKSLKELTLSVPGIAKLVNHLLEKHQGVKAAQEDIDKNLSQLLGGFAESGVTEEFGSFEKCQHRAGVRRYAVVGEIQKVLPPDFLFHFIRVEIDAEQRRRQVGFQRAFA